MVHRPVVIARSSRPHSQQLAGRDYPFYRHLTLTATPLSFNGTACTTKSIAVTMNNLAISSSANVRGLFVHLQPYGMVPLFFHPPFCLLKLLIDVLSLTRLRVIYMPYLRQTRDPATLHLAHFCHIAHVNAVLPRTLILSPFYRPAVVC